MSDFGSYSNCFACYCLVRMSSSKYLSSKSCSSVEEISDSGDLKKFMAKIYLYVYMVFFIECGGVEAD